VYCACKLMVEKAGKWGRGSSVVSGAGHAMGAAAR
jgi:hypothetical protein